MAKFCRFTQSEFEGFLGVGQDGKPLVKGGFHRIILPGTNELVYSKFVTKELCMRIYSTIEHGYARDNGSDAIRIVMVWKPSTEAKPKIVGGEAKVLRVEGWRNNLGKRLEAYKELIPPTCACGCPTVRRVPRTVKGRKPTWQPFWGCVWMKECPARKAGSYSRGI